MTQHKTPDKIDFKNKINYHFVESSLIANEKETDAINEFIVFLVTCFMEKNNFHVKNFNKKSLKFIKNFFSKLKTNILKKEEFDSYVKFFEGITFNEINCMSFIINNYISVKGDEIENKNIYLAMIGLLNDKKNELTANE